MSVRCLGNVGNRLLSLVRLIIGASGILTAVAASLCAIVFSMSVLIRGDGPSRGVSSTDPLLVLTQAPALKSSRTGTAAEMAAVLRREAMTADALIAAYRRTQVASATPQLQEKVAVATPAETRPAADKPAPDKMVVAEAVAPVEKPFPIPLARPAFTPPRPPVVAQEKPPLPPFEKGAPTAAPDANQLAYLPEQAATGDVNGGLFSRRTAPSAIPGRGGRAAIYDISAGIVYMPDGEKLEAHSGVGHMRDNPRFTNVRMLGPTPPATYALSLREAPFHGVDAIRLTPVGGSGTFGRDGFLAHTYMLRRPGDSNGCVVFADYDRFLKAFKRNEINTMIVVPRLQERLSLGGTDFFQG